MSEFEREVVLHEETPTPSVWRRRALAGLSAGALVVATGCGVAPRSAGSGSAEATKPSAIPSTTISIAPKEKRAI